MSRSTDAAQRKGVSPVLRKGVWFTAGLAAFVVVCLIATYAGESVSGPQGQVQLLQVAPVRRSAMASVQEVSAAFRDVALAEQSTQVFNKQLQELHSANTRAVRILQDDSGLVERPCSAKGASQIRRARPTSKCFYPAPPPGPGAEGAGCQVCVEGTVGYFKSAAEATAATKTTRLGGKSVCESWKSLTAGAFQAVDDQITKGFGAALALDDVIKCEVIKSANDTGYEVTQGPYCVNSTLVENAFTFYGDILNNLPNLTDAQIEGKLDAIAESQGGSCPAKTNAGVEIDSKYTFAKLSIYCNLTEAPTDFINLATGCDISPSH